MRQTAVRLINAQRTLPVNTARLTRVARCALRRLQIRSQGEIAITLIDSRRMRGLNKRFLRHDRPTDVLSFRYEGEPAGLPRLWAGRRQVIGEILIAPAAAQAYAKRHRLSYAEELSRYVVHGLLHWVGYEDRTAVQRRRMRAREDRLLGRCDAYIKGTRYFLKREKYLVPR